MRPAATGLLLFAAALLPALSAAAPENAPTPEICIIIDDLGYRLHEDLTAATLPGPLAFAIMPHTPHAVRIARIATAGGKDVLLHLPMEALQKQKNRLLGPGALTFDMSQEEFTKTLQDDLDSIPGVIGVNNHMGSLLTAHAGRMAWLMRSLRSAHKFYIDSMTSRMSVAGDVAREMDVPFLKRDVFLDNRRDDRSIRAQFHELVRLARSRGRALAIGHPYPETLRVLETELHRLDDYGVRLVSVRRMISETPAVMARAGGSDTGPH